MSSFARLSAPSDERLWLWILLSVAVHAGALFLFPPAQSGARSIRVRIAPSSALGTVPAAAKQSSADGRTVLTTPTPARAVQPLPRTASPKAPRSAAGPDLAATSQAPLAARTTTQRLPDSAPTTERVDGLDAAALRGLRVALAQGLSGIALPQSVAPGRTEATLAFGAGGRLLALHFRGDSTDRALEARLRAPLIAAANRLQLPPSLRESRFEVTLVLEFGE